MSTWYSYYCLFLVIAIIYFRKRRKRYTAHRLVTERRKTNQNGNGSEIMKELAQRFIGKDVYIKLLDGNADGVIEEVTDSGIILKKKENLQAVNLDYVMKIREYPQKKGKRGILWFE